MRLGGDRYLILTVARLSNRDLYFFERKALINTVRYFSGLHNRVLSLFYVTRIRNERENHAEVFDRNACS